MPVNEYNAGTESERMQCFHTGWSRTLGDTWRAIGMLFNMSEKLHEPVGLLYNCPRYSSTLGPFSIEHYVRDIIPEIRSKGTVVPLAKCPKAVRVSVDDYVPSVPTKLHWKGPTPEGNKIVCHFEGKTSAKLKCPLPDEVYRFQQEMRRMNFNVYLIRGGESIHELIERMADSDMYFGTCSGPAQIAYSVGIPVCIVKYKRYQSQLDIWHGPKPVAYVSTLTEMIELAKKGQGPLPKQKAEPAKG